MMRGSILFTILLFQLSFISVDDFSVDISVDISVDFLSFESPNVSSIFIILLYPSNINYSPHVLSLQAIFLLINGLIYQLSTP